MKFMPLYTCESRPPSEVAFPNTCVASAVGEEKLAFIEATILLEPLVDYW